MLQLEALSSVKSSSILQTSLWFTAEKFFELYRFCPLYHHFVCPSIGRLFAKRLYCTKKCVEIPGQCMLIFEAYITSNLSSGLITMAILRCKMHHRSISQSQNSKLQNFNTGKPRHVIRYVKWHYEALCVSHLRSCSLQLSWESLRMLRICYQKVSRVTFRNTEELLLQFKSLMH